MRAKYQILVIPFRKINNGIEFCIFKREDMSVWQGVAGGGEEGETILESAQREFFEESGIKSDKFIPLDSHSTVPACCFKDSVNWGEDFYVVPEYAFAVELSNETIHLSNEHKTFKWVSYEEADKLLQWDSNKTALWEINERFKRNKI
jgi:dATP pyrophosphohydrolase